MHEIEKEFVELYRTVGMAMGAEGPFPAIFARVFIEPEDIAMDDLAKELGYSLSSISSALKMLEPMGFIRKIKKPGSKKIYLTTEKDILQVMRGHLLRKERIALAKFRESLPAILEKYKAKKLSDEDKKKLKIVEQYYKRMLQLEFFIKDTVQRLDALANSP
ncbi:TPA: MarR family transcriptional regulator [Candidatus Woesearchaeota archaeon]|nr:MarR family transcriptional regulator [Candidatus Woesearchaeota archaeon]HII68689.1 MarR family transcriptional regulator [Candidatus Woesearchaeota archaeon]